MRIVFTRTGRKNNLISVSRDDGTQLSFEWPEHPGLPHDLVHVVVESELGMRNAFWGLVHDEVDVVQINAAATRALRGGGRAAEIDGRSLVELYRSEAVVAVFSSEAYGGPIDAAMRRDMIAQSCAQLGIADAPEIDDVVAARIRERLAEIGARWNRTGPGESLAIEYAVGSAVR